MYILRAENDRKGVEEKEGEGLRNCRYSNAVSVLEYLFSGLIAGQISNWL